jgi:predicted DNA-binding transcriptional regulator YafY
MCIESLEAIVKTSIWISYVSSDGTKTWYNVIPVSAYPPLRFEATKEFPEEQWLLSAYDCKSGKVRDFGMKNIVEWKTNNGHNPYTEITL